MLYLKLKNYISVLVSLSALSLPHTHTHLLLCPPSPVGLHTFKRMSQEKVRDFPFFSPSLSLTFNLGLVLEQWGLFKIHHICVDFHYRPLKMYLFFLWVTVWIFCIWQDSIFLLVFKSIVLIMQALLNRQILLLRWNYFYFNFNYSCLLDYWICSLEALYADKR